MYVVLSEIVIAETKNKYREVLESALRKTNSGIKELHKLNISASEMPNDTVEKAMAEYAEFLDVFIIESGMTVAEPYPDVSHQVIVERSLARKKPFKSDGKEGYCDFLIWLSFLEFVKITGNRTHFYFVTQNKKDFSDVEDDKKLHVDLLSDKRELESDGKTIHYYSSISDFVANVVNPMIEQTVEHENLAEQLLSCKDKFVDPIEKYVRNELESLDVSEYEIIYDGENPQITNIDDLEIDEIHDISKTGDEYHVQVRMRCMVCIDSYIFKSELAAMTDKEHKRLSITNPDWNKHYAAVENEVLLDIDVGVLLSINDLKNADEVDVQIGTIEISDISDSSYCPYCPDYDEDEEDDE